MDNFKLYAEYYNLLYKDKKYKAEADYVEKLFLELKPDAKTILDLGCGSGKHGYEFYKKGYEVTGVDLSEMMLDLAKELPENNIEFQIGDVRTIEINKKFDVVVSLFHVLSYQQSNEDVDKFFKTAKNHLAPGGILICDFWYGPGVLNDKPVVRKKVLENEIIKIIRIAEPVIHFDKNIVDVNYTMLINNKSTSIQTEINEQHKMRYFFLPEVELFAEKSGFNIINEHEWMSQNKPSGMSWNSVIVLRKINK
jgi:SAM-dependent methyltransferase